MTAVPAPILSVKNLSRRFGGIKAVEGVSFNVAPQAIQSLIGPNGAGKTTLFNVVTGLYPPTEGDVRFQGEPLTGHQPHEICRLGIARTFQNIRLFSGMTVTENVLVGRHTRGAAGLLDSLFHLPDHRRDEREGRERAKQLLEFVSLGERGNELAKSLAYGHRRRLEIARALASEPRLLLLDEPAAGLTAPEKDELKKLVRAIRDQGITVILIEHDMKFVMDLSDRVVVLDYGEKIADGTPNEVRRDPKVIDAYLGSDTPGKAN